MHKLFYIVLLIGITYSNRLYAQDKFEKESRIKHRDVPSEVYKIIRIRVHTFAIILNIKQ
jgi:hypothetical protein